MSGDVRLFLIPITSYEGWALLMISWSISGGFFLFVILAEWDCVRLPCWRCFKRFWRCGGCSRKMIFLGQFCWKSNWSGNFWLFLFFATVFGFLCRFGVCVRGRIHNQPICRAECGTILWGCVGFCVFLFLRFSVSVCPFHLRGKEDRFCCFKGFWSAYLGIGQIKFFFYNILNPFSNIALFLYIFYDWYFQLRISFDIFAK